MKPIAQLAPIEASLKEIAEKVGTIQNALPKGRKSAANAKSTKSPSLESTCREAGKIKKEIIELESEYEDTLGLSSVPASQRTALLAATEIRGRASKAYVLSSGLTKQIKAILNSVRDKLADDQLKEIESLEDEIKETSTQLQKFLLDMVPLGMSIEEWEGVSAAERSSLRSPGRPKPPLEAQISIAKRALQDQVALANRLSGGKLRTEEDVLSEVKTTGRGRPQVSELGKLDRQINALRKKLEDLANEEPSSMRDIKQNRVIKQINELQAEITMEENGLEGVDLQRRTLEKLRAKHRAIAVAEVKAVGQEQAQLLLSLLRNENEQREVALEIRRLDPEARLSLTQKINPTQTRKRFERLAMNGRLKEEELQEVHDLRRKFEEFTFSRNR